MSGVIYSIHFTTYGHTVDIMKSAFIATKISFSYCSLVSSNIKRFFEFLHVFLYLETGEAWKQKRVRLFLNHKYLKSYERTMK